jgi:hypothetical protein
MNHKIVQVLCGGTVFCACNLCQFLSNHLTQKIEENKMQGTGEGGNGAKCNQSPKSLDAGSEKLGKEQD